LLLGIAQPHRAAAALLAILLRSCGESFFVRARAPAAPLRVRPDFGSVASEISWVANRATMIAAPITSAGRFCPSGPRGI